MQVGKYVESSLQVSKKTTRAAIVRVVSCGALAVGLLLGPAGRAQDRSQAIVRVFTGARLIAGDSRPPIENAIIVVRDGRVAVAGPRQAVSIPSGAERIDLT